MDNLLENLNKEQLAAVQHKDGPLLIVAGAGTGKTTVVTQRIAYAIEQSWAKPDEILALTFTEKAAGEMEERVDRLLPFGYVDLWISTFHSFGERILKAHGLAIGLPGDFKLLNEYEQWALVRKNLDKFDLDYYRPLGNPTKFISTLIRHFSRAKDEDVSPADYLKYAEELKQNLDGMLSGGDKFSIFNFQFSNNIQYPISNSKSKIKNQKSKIPALAIEDENSKLNKEMAVQEIRRINEVANAYHVYQQLLLDNNALDFGDLINYCLKLFRERPAILEEYRRKFKYILLDEFQDTNWAQYELVKMLAYPHSNLVVVGDDDQSVYKFRGASVANILQFKKDFPRSKEVVLVRNYRNRQNILDLAYEFIQLNNPNRLEWQIKNQKLEKRLIAQNKGEGEIVVIEEQDLREETEKIAEKIADLKIKDKEASWNDFAVLVRANESAKEICAVLDAAGLPYIFLASRGLYAKPVILDLVAYLKLLDNYHESPAVFRILGLEIFEFTEHELVNFNFIARKKAWSLYTVLQNANGKLGADTQKKIAKVLDLINKHTAFARNRSASEVIIAFLNDSGYLKAIAAGEERAAQENLGYLNRFMKRVRAFEAAGADRSARAFLAELMIEIDAGEQGQIAPDLDAGPEAIRVMTIHAAKGLEFKYVFVANLVDKRFPTIEHKEPIQIPDALVKEILPEGDIHLEEERRLFYVAVTRAREGVYFTWSSDYGGARKKKPSRFLVEAGLLGQSSVDKKITEKVQNQNAKFQIKSKIINPKSEIKLPGYFSYTQLAAFSNCPYQYRFAHILRVPCRSKATFSFGQTMHLALQKIFERAGEQRGLGQTDLFGQVQNEAAGKKKGHTIRIGWEEIKAIYEEAWIDDWFESDRQKKEYRKLGEESLKAFHSKYKDNWPQTVSLEQGINLKLGGYRIYGKIDRIDEVKGGIQIVDYKTGSPKSGEKIGPDDKEQLLIYQLAAEQAFERKIVNLQFYYLNDSSEINFVGSDKELRSMEKKILERIEEIKQAAKTNDFPAKPGPLCQYCDFNGICEFRKS